jgi:hypothetical protein
VNGLMWSMYEYVFGMKEAVNIALMVFLFICILLLEVDKAL